MELNVKRARTLAAKEKRRQRLLEAALDEFFEKGFAAARMDDIAERAGLSKGSLYLYFKSKEDLFEALVDNLAGPKLDRIEKIATRIPSLKLALWAFARYAPKVIRESDMPRLMKVLVGECQTFPDIVATYRRKTIDRLLGALTTMLSNASARGEAAIDDPALTARLVVAPVVLSGIWQAVFAASDAEPIDLDALFAMHVRFLLKALQPEEVA